MNRLAALLAFSTVLAVGQVAKAADIVEAPPEVYDWTGFYIGANIGYAFGGDDDVGISIRDPDPVGFVKTGENLEIEGIFGGAQIGGDWQAGWAVFGVIADVEVADISDDFNNRVAGGVITDGSSQIDWWGTVRGRLGWAADNILIYGTGGFAWATSDYDVSSVDGAGNRVKMKNDDTLTGWTAGGGIAWAFDENWSAGVEYLYVNLGKETVEAAAVDPAGNPTGVTASTEQTPDFHSVKLLVNFKF